jgi:rhodanese-like domain
LEKVKKSDKLKELTQEQEISAVVLCPDGPFLYIDEYFKYCEKDQFPPIENKELLTNKVNNQDPDNENVEIDPLSFYELTKEHNQHFAEGNILIDLRSFAEFEHVHIKNAINLPFEQCDKNSFINYKDKRIFLVCNY